MAVLPTSTTLFYDMSLGTLARQHVTLYGELSMHPLKPKRYEAYRMYPKHHLFIHLAEDDAETHGNPGDTWNYLDEDDWNLDFEDAANKKMRTRNIHTTKYRRHPSS